MIEYRQTTKDATMHRYSSDDKLEIRSNNGTLHMIIGDREVAIRSNAGIITIPGRFYYGTFANPAAAANELIADEMLGAFEDRLPISTIPYVRRNFMDLDADDRLLLAQAFNHVQSLGYIDLFTRMHRDGSPSPSRGGQSIHFTPQFLPWHRWMVREMEKLMQEYDPRVTIPYWDTARGPAGDDLTESLDWDGPMLGSFFGGADNIGGHFDHWDIERDPEIPVVLPGIYEFAKVVRYPSYKAMRQMETERQHTGGHFYVGGNMTDNVSPKDPLFYLHHANVDRLWALWQLNNPDVYPQYDATLVGQEGVYDAIGIDDPLFVPDYISSGATAPTVREVLDHRALGYRYAHDQRLADYYPTEFSDGPRLWGDPDAFTIAPRRIEAEVKSGNWKIISFQLNNDTDLATEIEIERFPEDAQGHVDDFVWFPLHTTIEPHDSHDHFVVFAPKTAGFFMREMQVRVKPAGAGTPTNIIIPLIGTSSP